MTSSAYDVLQQALLLLLPEWLMLAVAVGMITAGSFMRRPRHIWALAAFGSMLAALGALVMLRPLVVDPYASVVLNDPLGWYGRLVALLSGFVLLAFCHDQVDDARAPEFFGALLTIFAGSMMVCAANELVF